MGILYTKKTIGRFKCNITSQETLISDLSLSEDELWSITTKTVRNEINRSKRENVGISVYHGKEISDALLNRFNIMYHDMYEEKGMAGHYLPINELKEYNWGGIASYESSNGIDKFKMSFGGEYRKYYNLFCNCSFTARVYAKIRKLLKR